MLNGRFSVRAGLEWRRYWYAMHSDPTANDPAVAAGAVDQSFTFTAGLAVRLGISGAPKPEGGGEEEAPGASTSDKPEGGEDGKDQKDRKKRPPKKDSDDDGGDEDAD
jgi:hypothetical protein